MKRLMTFLTVVLATTFILGACGSNNSGKEEENTDNNNNEATEQAAKEVVAGAAMQDGTYTLQETDFDENGWKASMEITVEDGTITLSNYNYEDADGQLKTEDEGYQEMMKDKSGVGPQEFVKQLNDGLVATGDAQLVDIVTGATHSSEIFVNYAQQLIQAAQNGNTETITINNTAALQDGEYSLVEKNIGSTGWKVTMDITVEDGAITTVDYNYLNAEDQLKTADDEYQELMTEKSGTGPQDYIPALNENLVETQDPAEVDIVTGATHSAQTFKLYAAQLVNAAQKGDTEQIVVDNYVYESDN
jgi:major membrane immunogen (membrane-anchored lipoprotein)